MLNSSKKIISIIKLTFRFSFIIAISQLLISCSIIKTAQFAAKDTDHNKKIDAKSVSLPKKTMNEQDQSRKKAINLKPYKIKGKWYYPQNDPTYKRVGEASWYGPYFHGRLTANGEVYDMNLLTAAHPTMPLPSYARVTNLKNGSSIIVRVNDRGPFMKDRIIDLSKQAATMLGYVNAGVTDVKVEYVSEAPANYYDDSYLMASYTLGDDVPSLLALKDNKSQSNHVTLKKKQLNKLASIKLPEIGPVLLDKPTSFNQIAFMNALSKKIK
ncbi:septal ring lytic transglycosylase RlpA family protein [Bartonella sp. CB189]|uniref:septal ring lytic transglycosylase RlpA family protein n=1 Tax=Bartonella sp. CB189 TaxID=3112254 RepID=UPI002F966028